MNEVNMNDDPQVLIERRDAIAIVTLNRPDKRNALSPEMIVRLARFWSQVSEDPAIRVVVVTGAGDRAFCSGEIGRAHV